VGITTVIPFRNHRAAIITNGNVNDFALAGFGNDKIPIE
jgi:hypothetical protein